jgi:membrane-anchored glycerophosphoryl diester phosphodiesterase (GDPDase)
MLCVFYHGANVVVLHMLLLFATLVHITYSTTIMICMKHCEVEFYEFKVVFNKNCVQMKLMVAL